MPPQPPRRFTLTDAMILVAAAALGFGGIRAEMTRHFHPLVNYHAIGFRPALAPGDGTLGTSYSATSTESPWFERVQHWAELARLAASCLATLSLALLSIRWSRPRPSWPRLIRQYGAVASLSATLALGICLAHALLKLLLEALHPTMLVTQGGGECSQISWLACQSIRPQVIGVVVLASWLTLKLGGLRRRERGRGWIDRTGIAVGWGWIGLLLIDLFQNQPM